jgi:hypothetical protein
MTEATMYQIGDQVKRIEKRESVNATVLSVFDDIDGQILELEYAEGGHGYWPANCVEPIGTT